MKKIVFISLFLLPFVAISQNQDFRLWLGANASKTFNKKYTVIGGAQARLNQNATQVYRYLFQGKFQYKVSKMYKVGLNYRFSDWNITNTSRIDLDNFFRYEWNKENFQIRLRFQREFGLQTTLENRIRVRFRYQHEFSKRLLVYGKTEYFYSNRYNLSAFDLQRYTVGTKFRVALGHFFDVFYRYEFQTNVEAPDQRFVTGIIYNFQFK